MGKGKVVTKSVEQNKSKNPKSPINKRNKSSPGDKNIKAKTVQKTKNNGIN